MPNVTTLVLKDGELVDTTFARQGVSQNGVATVAHSSGVPIGDKRITLSHSVTSSGRDKIQLKMVLPVVQDVTVNGISKPTAVRTSFFEASFTTDGTSNPEERADLLGFAWSLLGAALTRDLVVDLEYPY